MVIHIRKFYKILFFCIISVSVLSLTSPCVAAEDVNDPFESVNRNIFKFNNHLDDYFFKPVAKGWREIPDIPRKPLSNLATTAKTPISLANAILQLNKQSIGNILGRFLINMTFGLGGMFDVAGTRRDDYVPALSVEPTTNVCDRGGWYRYIPPGFEVGNINSRGEMLENIKHMKGFGFW